MAYCTLDILQSLSHAQSHVHLFMEIEDFKAELWIKSGQLKRVVASDTKSLLPALTALDPNLKLIPLNSKTFLEYSDEKIDLHELALQAAHHADLALQDKTKTQDIAATIKALNSKIFFSAPIPLVIESKPNKPFTLGRSADLCSYMVDDSRASRQHCSISEGTAPFFEIKDLKSTNGTYLNGSRITHSQATHGDFLRVGDHVFSL